MILNELRNRIEVSLTWQWIQKKGQCAKIYIRIKHTLLLLRKPRMLVICSKQKKTQGEVQEDFGQIVFQQPVR